MTVQLNMNNIYLSSTKTCIAIPTETPSPTISVTFPSCCKELLTNHSCAWNTVYRKLYPLLQSDHLRPFQFIIPRQPNTQRYNDLISRGSVIRNKRKKGIGKQVHVFFLWRLQSNRGPWAPHSRGLYEGWNFNFGNTPLDWIQELLKWRANAAGRIGPSPTYIHNGSGPSRNGHTQ